MSNADMPEPVARRLGYVLKRAQHALRLRMDEALRPLGITTPQYSVLCAVQADAGISNARLARAAFVSAQAMHGVLALLARNGLLGREPDGSNGRILRSHLTPKGRKLLTRAHVRVKRVEDIMIAPIGTRKAARLATILARFADDLGPADGAR